MRILYLYRPRVPAIRAQSVQVVHTCHALARRGHAVTLFADRGDVADPTAALAAYGLDHPPEFDLHLAPGAWPPLAGLWFRARVARWRGDVVYARAKRYVSLTGRDVPVVIEAHEVDSEQDREAGRDPTKARALEEAVFARASGVVANCGGTMALLEAVHRLPVHRRVIHNATRADRAVARAPAPEPLVGYAGSPRDFKGLSTVFESLPAWPAQLEMVGGAPPGVPAGVSVVPGVAYGALPALLARYHALLLPLEDNLFGRSLTSPLKLWDYLATGIPIVAADLPTIREIAGEGAHYYRPGDPASLADAVRRALAAGSSAPRLRTWDERAAEIEAFLQGLT